MLTEIGLGKRVSQTKGGLLLLTAAELEDRGTYRCVATNLAGNVTMDLVLDMAGKNFLICLHLKIDVAKI